MPMDDGWWCMSCNKLETQGRQPRVQIDLLDMDRTWMLRSPAWAVQPGQANPSPRRRHGPPQQYYAEVAGAAAAAGELQISEEKR